MNECLPSSWGMDFLIGPGPPINNSAAITRATAPSRRKSPRQITKGRPTNQGIKTRPQKYLLVFWCCSCKRAGLIMSGMHHKSIQRRQEKLYTYCCWPSSPGKSNGDEAASASDECSGRGTKGPRRHAQRDPGALAKGRIVKWPEFLPFSFSLS